MYEILDHGQNSFNDESQKIAVDCGVIPHTAKTAVLFIFGQSNATNLGRPPYTPDGHVYNLNLFSGRCFVASDPLLGTTGTGGSMASRLGDRLVKAGLFSDVVLVPIAVGGTYIQDWAPGGLHAPRIAAALKRVREAGFTPTFFLWHQGEANADDDPRDYEDHFRRMLDGIRSRGFGAPIFVPLASVCGGGSHAPVRTAQGDLVDAAKGIYPGPDTDTLGLTERFDTCHLAGPGLDHHAEMWFVTIDRYLKGELTSPEARVTAATIGAGPAVPVPPTGAEQYVDRPATAEPVRADYTSFGETSAVLPAQSAQVAWTDGAAILGLQFLPTRANAGLNIKIAINAVATQDNEFVVAIFRRDQPTPLIASMPVRAGERVVLERLLTSTTGSAQLLQFEVRVGLGKPGGRLFLNGMPNRRDLSLPAYVEISEAPP